MKNIILFQEMLVVCPVLNIMKLLDVCEFCNQKSISAEMNKRSKCERKM